MSAILALIGSKAGMAAIGALTAGAALFGPKVVDSLVSRAIGRLLEKALNPASGDPVRDSKIKALVHAALDLAEHEIPDRGTSDRIKKSVAAELAKVIPSAQAEVIGNLIQEAADKADEELKKASGS